MQSKFYDHAMHGVEMRELHAELMGRYGKVEGAIADFRFNLGGFLHDELVAFPTGTRHSGSFTRNGVDPGLSHWRERQKPLVFAGRGVADRALRLLDFGHDAGRDDVTEERVYNIYPINRLRDALGCQYQLIL